MHDPCMRYPLRHCTKILHSSLAGRWCCVMVGTVPADKPLFVHRQSAYLFGRERKVADIPIDHPSCSGQHAVLQYRQVEVPAKGEDEVGNRIVVR